MYTVRKTISWDSFRHFSSVLGRRHLEYQTPPPSFSVGTEFITVLIYFYRCHCSRESHFHTDPESSLSRGKGRFDFRLPTYPVLSTSLTPRYGYSHTDTSLPRWVRSRPQSDPEFRTPTTTGQSVETIRVVRKSEVKGFWSEYSYG